MRRCRRFAIALGLMFAIAFTILASPSARSIQAMQPVPTPRGQLGGPEPLPTESVDPDVESTATPDDARLCDVEPLPVAEIVAAAEMSPSPGPAISSWEKPASEAQTASAHDVITQLIDCANRNDPARLFALYTKEGIARSLQRQGVTGQTVPFFLNSSGEALPLTAQAQLVSIDRVQASGEDHLRAEFTLTERSGIGEFRSQTYAADLVNIDGDWLIDDASSV